MKLSLSRKNLNVLTNMLESYADMYDMEIHEVKNIYDKYGSENLIEELENFIKERAER